MILEGRYVAPDGWSMRWATQCPYCPHRSDCRHDCGHPGSVYYFQPDEQADHHVSGIVDEADVIRWRKQFAEAHTGQLELF
jgi:hypothetical protein